MILIRDYTVLQRNAEGTATGVFSGEAEIPSACTVMTRVVREDDNLTVIGWTECETRPDGFDTELRIPEGGLYRVEAHLVTKQHPYNNNYDWGRLIAVAQHVGVGDLFIMAGQSNMSGYGKDPAYDPPELGVHLFDNSGNWVLASHPLNCVPYPKWCNNDDSSGTSPGLSFGRMMHKRLGVPIGLIAAARGGSSIEAWNPFEKDPFLYKAMEEKILETGSFSGMIWAQGCNETVYEDDAENYYDNFEKTVSCWREKFGYFPIVTCQLNRHASKEGDRDRSWGLVRDAQRRASLQMKGVFAVPTNDLFTSDGIHNASGACVVIGERMANAMLKGHYGKEGCIAPSVVRAEQISEDTIRLTLNGEYMLRTMDDNACGMNIEDENGMMECKSVHAVDGGITVTGERKIGKDAVFHAYWKREQPAFFVRDIYGMPLLSCYGIPIEKRKD